MIRALHICSILPGNKNAQSNAYCPCGNRRNKHISYISLYVGTNHPRWQMLIFQVTNCYPSWAIHNCNLFVCFEYYISIVSHYELFIHIVCLVGAYWIIIRSGIFQYASVSYPNWKRIQYIDRRKERETNQEKKKKM